MFKEQRHLTVLHSFNHLINVLPDLLEEERQKREAEEKRRTEAEAAYQQWVKTKKNVKLRRLTPSPPRERDLKW